MKEFTSNLDWSKYNPKFLEHIINTKATTLGLEIILKIQPKKMMEVGIGGSQFMEQLMPHYQGEYVGVDGTASFIDYAKKKNIPKTSYVYGLMGDVEAPVVDLIYLRHVLEHNPDLEKSVEWLSKHTTKHVLVINFHDWIDQDETIRVGKRGISAAKRSKNFFVGTFQKYGLELKEDIELPDKGIFERILLFSK